MTDHEIITILNKSIERIYSLWDNQKLLAVGVFDRPHNIIKYIYATNQEYHDLMLKYIALVSLSFGNLYVNYGKEFYLKDFDFIKTFDFYPDKKIIDQFFNLKEYYNLKPKIIKSPPQPPSWGMELEIEIDEDDHAFRRLTQIFDKNAGFDGSGPWEFTIGVYKLNDFEAPYYATKFLYDQGAIYPQDQQGNHVHFRPADDYSIEIWKKAYFSGHLAVVFFFPLISNHFTFDKPMLRDTWGDWAKFSSLEFWNELKEFNYSDFRYWSGRVYSTITLNRHRKSVLTLECRAFESYPLKAYAFIQAWKWLTQNVDYEDIIKAYHRLRRLFYGFSEGNLNYFETKINKPLAGFRGSLRNIGLAIAKNLDEPAQEIIKLVLTRENPMITIEDIGKALKRLNVYI